MNIGELRKIIESTDCKIIDLLVERYHAVKEIGKIKHNNNLPFYVPERENSLLNKLINHNNKRIDDETLLAIYREIISGAIKLEQPLKIAYLGPVGTFSHQAALQKFGHGPALISVNSIAETLALVEKNQADYACIPIENSLEGVVNQTLDSLRRTDLKINSEFELTIEHYLVSQSPLEAIKQVYSHPQIIGQCSNFLHDKLPQAEIVEQGSSVQALQIAQTEHASAAIVSKIAAENSNLNIIAEKIQNDINNKTRFIVVGKQKCHPTGNDKSSICFAINNGDNSGVLYRALKPLKKRNISMSLIVSRPFDGSGRYCFFVDIFGHESEEIIAEAFEEIKESAYFFRNLGSYPV